MSNWASTRRDALALHATYRAQRSFLALDGLRAIGVILIILHHTVEPFHLGGLVRQGQAVVDMFFVLSGFLVVTGLLRERERVGEISLKRFYARRALRILPLYYAFLLGLCVLFGAVAWVDPARARDFFVDLPYAATFLTNWVPTTSLLVITWSLSAQAQFYVLWPLVERFSRRPLLLAVGLLCLSEAARFHVPSILVQASGGWFTASPVLQWIALSPILFGVLLAHLLHSARTFVWFARVFGARRAPAVVLFLLVLGLIGVPGVPAALALASVHVLMVLLVASFVVQTPGERRGLLESAFMQRLGRLSYAIYLLHIPVVGVVKFGLTRWQAPAVLLSPAVLFFTLLAAELTYRYYEAPFLEWPKHVGRGASFVFRGLKASLRRSGKPGHAGAADAALEATARDAGH